MWSACSGFGRGRVEVWAEGATSQECGQHSAPSPMVEVTANTEAGNLLAEQTLAPWHIARVHTAASTAVAVHNPRASAHTWTSAQSVLAYGEPQWNAPEHSKLTEPGCAVGKQGQAAASGQVQPLQGAKIPKRLWQACETDAAPQVQLPQGWQGAQRLWQAAQVAAACTGGAGLCDAWRALQHRAGAVKGYHSPAIAGMLLCRTSTRSCAMVHWCIICTEGLQLVVESNMLLAPHQ